MSIKKINFSPDFSRLSAWGHNKTPFFALVDFDGNLAAAPLEKADFSHKSGAFEGGISLGAAKVRFKLNVAPQHGGGAPGISATRQLFDLLETPPEGQVTDAIRNLQTQLGDGFSYLVNLCSQTSVLLKETVENLFTGSTAPFTVWLEDEFISFSPEPFVTVADRRIVTTPMKGTGYDATALLADTKEQAEHATIVDLLRNDLGRVAGDIRIDDYRYLTQIPQASGVSLPRGARVLYQTSTRISGRMPPDWQSSIGEWLPQLLPAGSISGAPKKKTVELIRQYETEPRGFFTGIAAAFDGENFYSCVLIRYLDLSGPVTKFRSGAGITIYSDPASEYREILSKVYIPAG